ncbi:MAG TPA: cobalamin-dependent protein [Streptosporangiaceae bacterium]|nr:cobalamin-dependent protein [Streptosporangiaceae bacterium]
MTDPFEPGTLLPDDLPNGMDLVRAGRERAERIPEVQLRYARERGVASDRAYKERCRDSGVLTTYINLGYKTWAETRDVLRSVQARGRALGYGLDRVSLIPDRRMGLPPDLRERALAETGLMMYTPQDWAGAGQDVDIAPIWNDHNLGSPAAVVNTEAALSAGFGYVGNMAQHNYGYPLWDDDVTQMARTVEAMGMIAQRKASGTVLEAYIEDGYCAGFHDLATSLGWCMFHRHVVEDLVGAAHSQSYGSTFQDPLLKQAFGLALQEINVHGVPPSFTHGDTNSFSPDGDFDRNAAIVFNDVYYTALRELSFPSGGALHATPVSEALRIPTEDELVQSLVIASEAVNRARSTISLMDWRPVLELRDTILAGGKRFFAKLMAGLQALGVDTADPLQLILATRRIGGSRMEELFGVGEPDSSYPRGFTPVVPTDTVRRLMSNVNVVLRDLRERGAPDLSGLRVVTASGDIHEYGLFVVSKVLSDLGAKVVDLGTSMSSPDIAKVAVETAADVVAVSTYNGMALSLGRQLLDELHRRNVAPAVYLGGRLNEDLEGESSADVSAQLEQLGITACPTLQVMVQGLRERFVTGPVSTR